MSDLPEDFPSYSEDQIADFDKMPDNRNYTNLALIYHHEDSLTFWCVPCRSSNFELSSRDLTVVHPVVRCTHCTRRWRMRKSNRTNSLQKLIGDAAS